MKNRVYLIAVTAMVASLGATPALAAFEKNICTSGGGVDRCSSEREMIGEATSVCRAKANEAASGFGLTVGDVSVNLTKHEHKSDTDTLTRARSCKFKICFDCKAETK